MAIKALIRRARIDNAIRQLSRHSTPRRFTHLIMSGANGRQFYEHVDTAVAGVFVFGLEDWASLPALAKTPEGGPLHHYMHATRTEQVSAEEFAGVDAIELYISGWVTRYVNGRRTDKVPFLGLELDDPTFLNALDPAFVVFRSDEDNWADVPYLYKLPDGSPRVDTDAKQETELITPPPPEE